MMRLSIVFFSLFALAFDGAIQAQEVKEKEYELTELSKTRLDEAPRGEITDHEWTESKSYPGTKRRYSVYVPAQYKQSSPAALMVFQDGHTYLNESGAFRVPVVFDNLIHSGDMPVTIGVFIDPGTHDELPEHRGWKPTPDNRSIEYDSLGPAYAEFLLNEILVEVEKSYKISRDPELRAICGISSGESARSPLPGSDPTNSVKC